MLSYIYNMFASVEYADDNVIELYKQYNNNDKKSDTEESITNNNVSYHLGNIITNYFAEPKAKQEVESKLEDKKLKISKRKKTTRPIVSKERAIKKVLNDVIDHNKFFLTGIVAINTNTKYFAEAPFFYQFLSLCKSSNADWDNFSNAVSGMYRASSKRDSKGLKKNKLDFINILKNNDQLLDFLYKSDIKSISNKLENCYSKYTSKSNYDRKTKTLTVYNNKLKDSLFVVKTDKDHRNKLISKFVFKKLTKNI